MTESLAARKERIYFTSPSAQFALSAVLQGSVTEAAVNRALAALYARHTLLRTVVRLRADGSLVFDPAPAIAPPTVKKESADWRALVDAQARLPFDLPGGEYMRVFLLDEMMGEKRLVMIVHHMVADGISALYLLRDLMRVLAGDEPGGEYETRLFDYTRLPEGKLDWMTRTMLRSVTARWNKTGRLFTYDECAQRQKEYWLDRHERVEYAYLDGDERASLKRNCTKNDVSINTALVTALIRARGAGGKIGVTVSLRPPEYEGIGNHATGISPDCPFMGENTSFWTHARSVHSAIYGDLLHDDRKLFLLRFMDALPPTLVDAACESALSGGTAGLGAKTARMFGYTSSRTLMGVSNLMRAPMPPDSGEIHMRDLTFIPPLALNQGAAIGAVTMGERTALTMRHAGGDPLKRVFDAMMDELRSASLYQ